MLSATTYLEDTKLRYDICRNAALWWLRKNVRKLNPALSRRCSNCKANQYWRRSPKTVEESVQHYTSLKETEEPTGIPFWNQEWWSICGRGFLSSFSLLVYLLYVLGSPRDIDYWCLVGERIRIVRKRTNKWLICYILPFTNWCWWHRRLYFMA